MATISRNKSGTWKAEVRKQGVREYKSFDRREDAVAWAAALETKVNRRVFDDLALARETTLFDAMESYWAYAQEYHKGSEPEGYRMKRWQNHRLGKKFIADITASDVESYRQGRKAEGVSDATIRNEIAVLRAAWLHGDFNVECPTGRSMRTLKTATKRNRRLSNLEEQYLLAAVHDTGCSDAKRANKWLSLVVIFAIETAARLEEIVRLKSEDVHLSENLCIFRDTKNGRDRHVPLSPVAVGCIREAWKVSSAIGGVVFKTTISAVKQSWMRARERARTQYIRDCAESNAPAQSGFLEDLRFHDLRHEAASRWSHVFDHYDLKQITGHLDDRSLSRYVNKSREDVKGIAKKMTEAA